jgi:hypothetical protein
MNAKRRPCFRRSENLPNGVSNGAPHLKKHMDSNREVGISSCLGDFCMSQGSTSVPRLWAEHGAGFIESP